MYLQKNDVLYFWYVLVYIIILHTKTTFNYDSFFLNEHQGRLKSSSTCSRFRPLVSGTKKNIKRIPRKLKTVYSQNAPEKCIAF